MGDGAVWGEFEQPVPAWFTAAKIGIFVHWGAYSVPAWAEPTGELGAVEDEREWLRHNPYAEWYFNTIRIDGSPAQQHHLQTYGGRPYDDFLDEWRAESFDPADLAGLFARAGARYVVPTTKHHDGITLWDAPGTNTRNTVRRGPKRDLVAAFAEATRAAGMHFGVYYSGGLDWHVSGLPALEAPGSVYEVRPRDEAYGTYAYLHVKDLVDRYRPDILWNDIEWPDRAKHDGSYGLAQLFRYFYDRVPDGVVNDRWGDTHFDFRCSEYQAHRGAESAAAWENTRGLGLSFGYNQIEDASVTMDAHAVTKYLLDVVSRGGNLLLNVGPMADGRLAPLQRASLEGLAGWMRLNSAAVHDTRVVPAELAAPSDDPWVRWTMTDDVLHAAIDARGSVVLAARSDAFDLAAATGSGGRRLEAGVVSAEGTGLRLTVSDDDGPGPAVVHLPLRHAASA